MKNKKGANSLKTALPKIFKYLNKKRFFVFGAFVLAALGAVLTIVGPNQIGKITDYMSEGLMGSIDLKGIARVGITLAVIYLLSALFTYLQHLIMAVVTLKSSKQMRRDISEKINRVPQKYFNKVPQGDILSLITNDVSTLQQTLSNSLPAIISALA